MTFEIVKSLDFGNIERDDNHPGGRHYHTPLGCFPSVTTVLSATEDKTWLIEWRKRVGDEKADEVSRNATTIGTGLHTLAECYVQGIEPPKVPGQSKIMFTYLRPQLDKNLGMVCGIEVPLYSDRIGMAGSTDLVGFWKGKLSIIDHKSNHSDKNKKDEDIEDYFIQISAYSEMWNDRIAEINGPKIKQGVILMASKYGRQVWEFNPYDYTDKLMARIRQYHEMKGGSK